MMDIAGDLLLWFILFFDKKLKGRGVNIPSEFNKQLAEELHKQIIRNLLKKNRLFKI